MMRKQKTSKMLQILRNNFYMLGRIYRFCPGHFFITLFSALMGSVSSVFSLYLTRYIINSLSSGSQDTRLFWRVALLVVAMGGYNLLFLIINSRLQNRVTPRNTQIIHQKMQLELFQKATEVELQCYEDAEFYDKFSMAMQQSDSRAMAVLNTLASFMGNLFGIGALAALIGSFEPLIIAIVLVNVLLGFLINTRTIKLQHEQTKERVPPSRESGYAQRIFFVREYAKELRLYPGFDDVLKLKFNISTEKIYALIEKYGKKFNRFSVAQGTISTVVSNIIMLYLAAKVIAGKLLIGDFVAISSGAQQLARQISGLIGTFPQLYEHSLYIENFREFVEYQPSIPMNGGEPVGRIEELCIEGVTFSYPHTDKQVLQDIEFQISAGERVAIVGRNGCGKSTLVKLIARLYDPDDGKLLVNGMNYTDCAITSLREKVGVVFQDYCTFAVTIAENVLMREASEADAELVWDALRFAGLYEKVASLPGNIHSKLTREFENSGVFLSGGEFQKLALARVYARQCSLIVLDEPSSALDPISENEMFSAVKKLSRDRCAIMISHRLANIRDADRIYVMDNGRIVDVGTHDELMSARSLYYEMYVKQNEQEYAEMI